MSILGLWLLLAVVVGFLASSRGRNGFGWFLISIILSPLLGLIFLLIAGDGRSKGEILPTEETHVRCDSCHELIYPQAKVCRYCGSSREQTLSPSAISRQARLEEAEYFGNQIARAIKRPGTWVLLIMIFLLFYVPLRMA